MMIMKIVIEIYIRKFLKINNNMNKIKNVKNN